MVFAPMPHELQLSINGEKKSVSLEQLTIQKLLCDLGYDAVPVAIAVNDEFVPKTQFERYPIRDGQRIDILMPMQGG